MFRLRAAEGLALSEIADLFGLHTERIRQLLQVHWCISGCLRLMGRRLEDDLKQGFASHQAVIMRGRTALVSPHTVGRSQPDTH